MDMNLDMSILKDLPMPIVLAGVAIYSMEKGESPYVTFFAIAGLILLAALKITER